MVIIHIARLLLRDLEETYWQTVHVYACDPANIASKRVLKKIGMQCEGHLQEHKWTKEKWRDSLMYTILEREWKQLKLHNTKIRY